MTMTKTPSSAAERGSRWAFAIAASNAVAVSGLIGVEALFLLLSLDWSLVGLFHLGSVVSVPVIAVSVGAVVWLTQWIFRRAWAIEQRIAREGDASL